VKKDSNKSWLVVAFSLISCLFVFCVYLSAQIKEQTETINSLKALYGASDVEDASVNQRIANLVVSLNTLQTKVDEQTSTISVLT